MKVITAIILTIAILSPITVDYDYVNTGQLLGAMTLRDGGSVVISFYEEYATQYFRLVYIDGEGKTITEQMIATYDGLPDYIIIKGCRRHVQLFANWFSGYDYNSAAIYRYHWELPPGVNFLDDILR